VEIDWTAQLVDQLEFQWSGYLRPRLATLTDDAYRWEPVPGCWSIRPRADAVCSMPVGAGDTIIDFELPEPVPPPVTTIAWRMGHLAIGVFGMRAANHFGDGGVAYESTDWPLTTAGGLDLLEGAYRAWLDGVKALDREALARPVGPQEGPFAEYPMATLILHINREAIHHGAEVCLLRDLYPHRTGENR
jgi:hypothetical protein